ncbi:hypothetical protein [Paenibacillus larvae]|uniref:Uncharacterized protein n=1 Tax=Paenibacillus larvae subsp. larvae TaxID=147375 RepID=A0A2L1U7I5_9BACL|nr:hypothetical protein [Paenibacillus larvae]AVF28899.1 hypothetical protein ERICIII_04897 [Paenibacillus larvae subsp. larvae]MCY9502632.1 hypothetical protein [Paenibacillus larvae]MDR5608791.1 hypothetical protein [Paenibacillus larvae]
MEKSGIRAAIGTQQVRKIRSDKKHPVLPKLKDDAHRKLKKLALACGISKTKLAEEILTMSVNHIDIINFFQSKYKADEYRIIPIRNQDGTVEY